MFAAIGREILHIDGNLILGPRRVVHGWDSTEQDAIWTANGALEPFGLKVDLHAVPLTQKQLETLEASLGGTTYCSDLFGENEKSNPR
jgi:hypothetical protein